ncbi:sigma-70 family RNA polymerase sigma factor [Luteolibacter pohnpeiensis]|uniref:Sigma-70 family RNA polymerase sigma factor n=1 Tax=Luteolibacter pohnpeiensis TaxID=454153 RepID=A0A934VWM3_9BACT|nr:sigma-70 family RNA polymerase sigma factor [Luteolibacter pohnpeiensis]MBK1883430.1 sigma-70 family RNA polymerase sigma factor [Luteolibacter pohnpeiensis]
MIQDSDNLLLRFHREQSETAFRELVACYSTLVFRTAMRKLNGDRAAAEDVCQEVFSLLAKKAHRLRGVVLSSWLYRQTCRRASNHIRTESRRRVREKIAAESHALNSQVKVTPELSNMDLDDALNQLPTPDRDALVLRYFEGMDHRTIGGILGISEDAARKRVKRALDRLATMLRNDGLDHSAAFLGSTLAGLPTPPLPSTFVAQISAKAWAGHQAASSTLMSHLAPIAAGVAITSMIAAPFTMRRKNAVVATLPSKPPSHPMDLLSERERAVVSTSSDLLEQLKRLNAKPRDETTRLQMLALTDLIGVAGFPEFFAAAKTRLSQTEKNSIYYLILEQEMKRAPAETMLFVFDAKIGDKIDSAMGTRVIGYLWRVWSGSDPIASGKWIVENWTHRGLTKSSRDDMVLQVGNGLFVGQGTSAFSEFLAALPDAAARERLIQKFKDNFNTDLGWEMMSNQDRIDRFVLLDEVPVAGKNQLKIDLAKRWATKDPEGILRAMKAVSPEERFYLTLGRFATVYEENVDTPMLGGGFRTSGNQVSDSSTRLQQAEQAGLDAGLPRDAVLVEIGRVHLTERAAEEAMTWFDDHRDDANFDLLITEKVRDVAQFNGSSNYVPFEVQAIEWAKRISDPALRLQLSRGAFTKLLGRSPEEAIALATQPGLPTELSQAFSTIITEFQ